MVRKENIGPHLFSVSCMSLIVAVLCKMAGFQDGENRIQNLYLFHCKFTFVELLELNEFVLGLPGVQRL